MSVECRRFGGRKSQILCYIEIKLIKKVLSKLEMEQNIVHNNALNYSLCSHGHECSRVDS